MPAATTSWFCDSCGGLIEAAGRGWVEWVRLPGPTGSPPRGRGIRIVHHTWDTPNRFGCQYSGTRAPAARGGGVSDDALVEFLGPDGLTRLLGMIAEGSLPTADLLEVIRRLHTPGYEWARPHFDAALEGRVIVEGVASGGWRQSELQSVLDFARGHGWPFPPRAFTLTPPRRSSGTSGARPHARTG